MGTLCAAVDRKMSTTSQGYLARSRKLNATHPIAFECFSFPPKKRNFILKRETIFELLNPPSTREGNSKNNNHIQVCVYCCLQDTDRPTTIHRFLVVDHECSSLSPSLPLNFQWMAEVALFLSQLSAIFATALAENLHSLCVNLQQNHGHGHGGSRN